MEKVKMGMAEEINAIEPVAGKVVPIRTIYQTHPPEVVFCDVWVVEIHMKATSKVIHILNCAYPRNRKYPLNHLKRFTKREALPEDFRNTLPKVGKGKNIPPTLFGFIPPHAPNKPLPDADEIKRLLAPYAPTTYNTNQEPDASKINLYKTKIPFQSPFTERQSNKWAQIYWPMSWNPAVPKSTAVPPPQLLNKAQNSIDKLSGYYIALAQKVAKAGKESGRGRGVGAVVVDPRIQEEVDTDAWQKGYDPIIRWMDKVVAVAEDARFARSEGGQPSQAELHTGPSLGPACLKFDPDTEGGPDLHALMRAVELVALCRRSHADEATVEAISHSDLVGVHTDPQLTKDLSPLETWFLNKELTKPPTPTTPVTPSTPDTSLETATSSETNPPLGTNAPLETTAFASLEATTPLETTAPLETTSASLETISASLETTSASLETTTPLETTAPPGKATSFQTNGLEWEGKEHAPKRRKHKKGGKNKNRRSISPELLFNPPPKAPKAPKKAPKAPPSESETEIFPPVHIPPVIFPDPDEVTSSTPSVNSRDLPTEASISGRADGGYLCAELDVYLSHEPCWTCSMGVCLSRFRAVIFPRSGRMKTGGLSTEPINPREDSDDECEHKDPPKDVREKYYGMFYREELNWRALGFEFIEDEEPERVPEEDDDVEFHA